MDTPTDPVDLLVVGAGPIGLACALEAERAGLTARVVEKGALVNSLVGYPTQMEFFSTPELLEIGGHPLATTYYKPRREETIDYYRAVAQREGLDVRLGERVLGVDGERGDFVVRTSKGAHRARAVAVATGFFDQPNRLGIPGDDLGHVSHYYKEPYPFSGRRVVVVGAKNSAAKAALEIFRHGGHVTLVVRGAEITTSVKYWIRPDLLNRIKEGSIDARFGTTVEAITPETVRLAGPDGTDEIPADAVLLMTGYHPDFGFLEALGVELAGPERAPVVDDDTMESTRPGVYLAGTVCGGYATSRWFIENGRIHAARIAADLAGLPVPELEAHGQP
ncbi:YpdA family putative bacillithiol disulfide reductase [Rubrivirga sp. IMCC43871]|uniref:YpdA family putative bacillithiol disulfide reductase n=1 Tax=Rubrivirga sp. IMCC43871 TaxID=3391575 RepID=UPI00398FC830